MLDKRVCAALLLSCLLLSARPTHIVGASISNPRVTLLAGTQYGTILRSTDDGTQWKEVDPGLVGEDITTLALGSATDGPFYAGTAASGVFISTNGGTTWHGDNGSDNVLAEQQITGLAVDPSDPHAIYAATVQNLLSSTDSGQTWSTLVTLPAQQHITSIALSTRPSRTLLVGTSAGILRVLNGVPGRDSALPMSTVRTVAFGARTALVAYALTSMGIYQTIDGGRTWQADRTGLPSEGTDFTGLAASPTQPGVAIVATHSTGLYRTIDGGTTWQPMDVLHTIIPAITVLLFDPGAPQTILAGGYESWLYQSTDEGLHWHFGALPNLSTPSLETILCLAAVRRAALPTDPVNPPSGSVNGVSYFPATGHIVRAPILDFYNKNNGLKIFGLPLTEAFTQNGKTVQYFERAELIAGTTRVSEAHLGSILTQGRPFSGIHPFVSSSSKMYFPATRHSLGGDFLKFWQGHHGAQLFGSPLSEPLREQNSDGTGRTYLVQYFQNARLEYHPELAGTGNEVELGLLGKQILQQRGWL